MADNISILDSTGATKVIAATDSASVFYQNVIATNVIAGTAASSLGKAEDAAHANGDTGVFTLAVRTDTRASSATTTGDYTAFTTDASGSLWVNPGAAAMAALADATTNPTAALLGCCSLLYNGSTWDRVRGDTTNGIDVDVTRVIPGTTATALGKAEDAAHASGDTGVMALAVQSTTLAATAANGDYAPLQVDGTGALWVNNSLVATMTGPDVVFDSDADNTAQVCKAAAGVLAGIHFHNPNGSVAYVQFFNTAAGSVTVGTTPPVHVVQVPANGSYDVDYKWPLAFSTAITYAATTTPTGNGDPATGLIGSLFYK